MYEYERLKEYICKEPRMKPFLEQSKDECMQSNCQSWVVILEIAIEKLLDAYEDKCDEVEWFESKQVPPSH